MNYALLREKRPLLVTRRLVLTHMGRDMLERVAEVDAECASDGMEIHL